jgi:type I restriction enzyme M protein
VCGFRGAGHYADLRLHILKTCRVETVLELPEDTFKPNKINVKSSVLVLRRRDDVDEDLTDNYPISFVSIKSLGYDGSGTDIRGFDLPRLIKEVAAIDANKLQENVQSVGYMYSAFSVRSKTIATTRSNRLDVKFWNPQIRMMISKLREQKGVQSIKDLNLIETRRGKSPPAAEYVSASEGYALVVKSGSNISKAGDLLIDGDYIEQSVYQDYVERDMALEDGDILLSSTGDGTLGKCCVYRNRDGDGKTRPGVPEGHVTVIRVNQSEVHPEYLCDYLRKGFGGDQITRLFTGATGMIEITPEDVNEVLVPRLPSLPKQQKISEQLRSSEKTAAEIAQTAATTLQNGETVFRQATSDELTEKTP